MAAESTRRDSETGVSVHPSDRSHCVDVEANETRQKARYMIQRYHTAADGKASVLRNTLPSSHLCPALHYSLHGLCSGTILSIKTHSHYRRA